MGTPFRIGRIMRNRLCKIVVFPIILIFFTSASCLSDDSEISITERDGNDIEVVGNNFDFSTVRKFYKSNPLAAYSVAFFNEYPIVYKEKRGVPAEIDPSVFTWDNDELIFLTTGEEENYKVKWGDLFTSLTGKSYISPKGSRLSLFMGIFKENRDENNKLYFNYVDKSSRAIISLPVFSNKFSIPKGSIVVIEGEIKNGLVSPGGNNPVALRIEDFLVVEK